VRQFSTDHSDDSDRPEARACPGRALGYVGADLRWDRQEVPAGLGGVDPEPRHEPVGVLIGHESTLWPATHTIRSEPVCIEQLSIIKDVAAALEPGASTAVRPINPDPLPAAAGHPHECHARRMAWGGEARTQLRIPLDPFAAEKRFCRAPIDARWP
jgi:hypothetical protein